jgi:hypothetical protein
MTYRGIPGIAVHLYQWAELRNELIGAGFRINKVIALDSVTARPIRYPSVFHAIRAGGWILFAERLG